MTTFYMNQSIAYAAVKKERWVQIENFHQSVEGCGGVQGVKGEGASPGALARASIGLLGSRF